MRRYRVIPFDKPNGAAVYRVIAFVHIVEFLKRQLITLVAQKRFNALCIALVLFAPLLSRRVRQISCNLTLYQFIRYVAYNRCVCRSVAVYFYAALILLKVFVEFIGQRFSRRPRLAVQVLKKR